METSKLLLGKREAAFFVSLSVRKLEYLIQTGELFPVRKVGSRVLIPRKTLEEFARRDHPTGPRGEGRPE
jgi:excisionase family DNA binding protein